MGQTKINILFPPCKFPPFKVFKFVLNSHSFLEFCNNEDVRCLFIFTKEPKNTLEASLSPPTGLRSKAMFFLKTNQASKLTKDNIKTDVVYTDCDTTSLTQLDLLSREVTKRSFRHHQQVCCGHNVLISWSVCTGLHVLFHFSLYTR